MSEHISDTNRTHSLGSVIAAVCCLSAPDVSGPPRPVKIYTNDYDPIFHFKVQSILMK